MQMVTLCVSLTLYMKHMWESLHACTHDACTPHDFNSVKMYICETSRISHKHMYIYLALSLDSIDHDISLGGDVSQRGVERHKPLHLILKLSIVRSSSRH